MFLDQTIHRNKHLVQTCFQLHQEHKIRPDTYVIDIDQLLENAEKMLEVSRKNNIDLYFMLKQLGRNPYIAKELVRIGFKGAVVVDFKEAAVLMRHNIPICNVGHLVQMPQCMVQELINYGCEYFTIFSIEKAKEINEAAKNAGIIQKILLKVVGPQDMIYSGQTAGFYVESLEQVIKELKKLDHIKVSGVTSFPSFLFDEKEEKIIPTPNLSTLMKACSILESKGIQVENVNAPSATCSYSLEQMKFYMVNSAEPGHGLTGTTPMHANVECVEKPAVCYVSEISHNFKEKAYCYGGGHYRRSHVANAIVGKNLENSQRYQVIPPTDESIDYYFGLDREANVSDTVIMAFRFQIFVTRSDVVLVKGIQKGNAEIIGIYNSLGEKIHE